MIDMVKFAQGLLNQDVVRNSKKEMFRQYLKEELPEFTEKEITKIHRHIDKIKGVYEFQDACFLLDEMYYELKKMEEICS